MEYILLFGLGIIIVAYLIIIIMKKKIERDFYYNKLTGLPTKEYVAQHALALFNKNKDYKYIATIIDLNRFTAILDRQGNADAKKVVKACAVILKSLLEPERDLITQSRFGDFIIFRALPQNYSEETFKSKENAYYEKVQKTLFEKTCYIVQFSIAYFFLTSKELSKETNMDNIYEKLFHASFISKKVFARSRFFHYNTEAQDHLLLQNKIEHTMEKALEDGEFVMYLQPKIALESETLIGAEALVRWQKNQKNIVFPDQFIPLFEENGFIIELDMYMFRQACKIIKQWIEEEIDPVPISINFSRLHFYNENFVNELIKIKDEYCVPTQYLELEITESNILENEEILLDLPYKLQAAGFALSMDDFGTGCSSLGLLKDLPLDTIKLDRSFFQNTPHINRARTVIANTIKLAKELGILIVAEGVEKKEDIDFLKSLGCDYVQGYYYARPMPAEDFIVLNYKYIKSSEPKNKIVEEIEE